MAAQTTVPEMLSAGRVVKLVGVSRITLARWVAAGEFPRPLRFGRRTLRWRADELFAWLESKKIPRDDIATPAIEREKEFA